MVAFNKFNQFTEDLAKKVHNLGADVLKVALTNTLPVNTNTVLANITQISAANGYTSGGNTPAITSCAQTAGVLKLILVDTVFTAAGGSIGPFQYVVLYNSTAAGGPLIGWWNYGSAVTLADTETFTVDFDGAAGVLTIT
jgi:hypothetical protein